jgi:hypothetical protein
MSNSGRVPPQSAHFADPNEPKFALNRNFLIFSNQFCHLSPTRLSLCFAITLLIVFYCIQSARRAPRQGFSLTDWFGQSLDPWPSDTYSCSMLASPYSRLLCPSFLWPFDSRWWDGRTFVRWPPVSHTLWLLQRNVEWKFHQFHILYFIFCILYFVLYIVHFCISEID